MTRASDPWGDHPDERSWHPLAALITAVIRNLHLDAAGNGI